MYILIFSSQFPFLEFETDKQSPQIVDSVHFKGPLDTSNSSISTGYFPTYQGYMDPSTPSQGWDLPCGKGTFKVKKKFQSSHFLVERVSYFLRSQPLHRNGRDICWVLVLITVFVLCSEFWEVLIGTWDGLMKRELSRKPWWLQLLGGFTVNKFHSTRKFLKFIDSRDRYMLINLAVDKKSCSK